MTLGVKGPKGHFNFVARGSLLGFGKTPYYKGNVKESQLL